MTNIAEQTLAKIVTNNNQVVPVFEKHDLDFCCKGRRTLSEACLEKGISVEDIIRELEQQSAEKEKKQMPFELMNASQLIGYILIHHHFYVKQSMPMIMEHLRKVVSKHGDHFTYMPVVMSLFSEIQDEMTSHMQKEEHILFPRIKEVELLFGKNDPSNIASDYISGPIQVMEAEHDHAGEILYEIRRLTNNYTPPVGACTTFQVTMAELKEFEEDLHAHVHLENNILFQLAENMMVKIKEK